jgi:hypothetical protein
MLDDWLVQDGSRAHTLNCHHKSFLRNHGGLDLPGLNNVHGRRCGAAARAVRYFETWIRHAKRSLTNIARDSEGEPFNDCEVRSPSVGIANIAIAELRVLTFYTCGAHHRGKASTVDFHSS